jgi:glycosyltransferase involved in cell wall biosynthesis
MTRPLSFLHLTTFYPPYSFGGDAMYIYRLAHALGDAGHHVEVVHCVDAYHLKHPQEPEIAFDPHPSVVVHTLRSGFGLLSPLLTQQTGRPVLKKRAIQRILDSRAFDVVHFHNMSLLGPDTLRLESRHGPSVKLYTTHEHWLVCPMHVLWKYGKRVCERPDCVRCTIAGGRPPQLWRYTGLLERAAGSVDRFVAPSQFTAGMHESRGFPVEVGHLPYFIDREDSDWMTPEPRPHARPYFLFVGRLEVIKGLQNVIEAWRKVDGFDLLVAGAGDFADGLRRLAGSDERIVFLGPQSQRALAALYFHAEALLVPSLTYETFGMTIIEAYARKTPVVAHDLGALSEVVEESGGGYLYRSEQEMLDAIRRIGGSRAHRDELGERGYAVFVENWDREAHLRRYYALIDEVAREKFGGVPWDRDAE